MAQKLITPQIPESFKGLLSNGKVVQNSILERTEKKVSLLEGRQSVTLYSKGLFLLYLFRFWNTNRSENTRSFCVNRNRNSIPVLVYKPGQSRFTLVYVGLP